MQVTKSSSISQTMQDAINDQIQAELESAYLYLALAARMEQLNLKGFAHWLRCSGKKKHSTLSSSTITSSNAMESCS